jgi:DNA-directed RNA polymerase specialized sigma subunit
VQSGVTSAQELGYKEDETISTHLHQVEQRKLYDEKLGLLGTSCQEVLALFFKQVSMKDIAKKLGTSEQYAKKKKFNCKSKLIELIKADAKYGELII